MDERRTRWLRIALVVFGTAFLLVYPLMALWPSGWAWEPRQPEYELMMVGIYATLGVFLLRAARHPWAHSSLIWFTVWSSVVHGGIMLVLALRDPAEHGHLPGDVAALFVVAAVLGALAPRGARLPDDLGTRHELHGVQPVLPVPDVGAAAAFFRDVLGFELDFLEGDPPVHGRVRKGDGRFGAPVYVHLTREERRPAEPPSGELRIHVGRDVDGLFAAYRERGVEVVFEPTSQPWGLREFAVRTPEGHVLRFCGYL